MNMDQERKYCKYQFKIKQLEIFPNVKMFSVSLRPCGVPAGVLATWMPTRQLKQLAIENGIISRGFAQQMVIFPSFLYVYHWLPNWFPMTGG